MEDRAENHVDDGNIQPFQYEPSVSSGSRQNESSSDSESNNDGDSDTDPVIGDNTDWCDCGSCVPMRTVVECRCCHYYAGAREKMEEGGVGLQCVTQHEGFPVNFTNRHVLQLAVLEYVSLEGPLDDNEPLHETYRYVAYRRFSLWIHGKLRKHDRRPIPSCVVNKIRAAFPSEHFVGFKYA